MFAPTPGVKYLATAFLRMSTFALPLFGVQKLAEYFEMSVSGWSLALGCSLVGPIYITLLTVWTDWKNKRAAHALGARLAPAIKGKKIGNYDFLQQQIENFKSGYPDDGLSDAVKKLGPVVNFRVFWTNVIFTTSPEHIKLILATDFANYVKGEQFDRATSNVLGTGVFNSDGDIWKFHRGLTRPHFNREKITDFDLFDRHSNEAIQLIKDRCAAGYAVDFQDLLHRFTLDTATEFLLGHCVHTLHADLPYPHNIARPLSKHIPQSSDGIFRSTVSPDDFASAFMEAQYAVVDRVRKGWIWPLFEIFQDKTVKPMKVVSSFIDPLVSAAVERRKSGERLGEKDLDSETLLDHLVKSTEDPKILKDETINILVAGRDTTAATTTYALYFLAKYPNVMQRLRDEVMDKVGPTSRPTFDVIKDMPYLRAVLNETLRLFPVVPFNVRSAVEARVWPSPDPTEKPIYIPAGTETPYSVFMMHRRTDLWGPDAQEFDPDRFLDERVKKYLLKNNFIFLPFNAGPRICLGQQFAYNEMSYFLIKLLQQFSSFTQIIEAGPPESRIPTSWAGAPGRKGIDQVKPKSHLTLYAEGGLWLKAD
ncbi:cytochrome P450 monooxygenase pc-1 [Flagelloscypha sp. PMI_526]|nr:cytochrome P450 monooxygenase pc-1 [Flagelloscypha sp. PMI_526]